ncbi:MAG: hypothetical protein NTV77_00870 [Candidatus Azambacteria bacterium]|nr:hypothetical protein [Candidatus Azambacteria bacterium]
MKKKKSKSKLLKAIKKEALRDRKNAIKCGNTCGEQDCSETNCSSYCSTPPHQD